MQDQDADAPRLIFAKDVTDYGEPGYQDPANIPEPVSRYGFDEPSGVPTAFFLTVFGRLEQTGTSKRTGVPILGRTSRVWGWFPTFAAAYRIVAGNITDIQECCYEYALVEEIPPGMSPLQTRCWWWRWDTEKDRWLKSERPEDFARTLGLTLG